ncbi:conserved hypothetical protein [Ricinus communis]|uniref:DUF7610 domain-containing protein n=1 Tax=Ricinus communis TaxID=3988 RepID=B9R9S2_RICCO|nr:conserved hypothetical protein [Ricinus communis]
MTKRYSVLQKKLQELESFLKDVFSLNPLDHNLHSQDIEQRLEFLKTLLSAEITSSPEKPHHLQHISKRLSELESIVRDWHDYKTTTMHEHNVETVSTCSCTESCLNDDGEATFAGGSCGFEETENAVEGSAEENNEEEVRVEEMSEAKKEEKRSVGVAVGWRMFGSLMIGMALMGFVMTAKIFLTTLGSSLLAGKYFLNFHALDD